LTQPCRLSFENCLDLGAQEYGSGTLFSFRLRASVEILGDNNASPVAPLISWKCNYEPGMGESRLRRWKEIRPRSVSRGRSGGGKGEIASLR